MSPYSFVFVQAILAMDMERESPARLLDVARYQRRILNSFLFLWLGGVVIGVLLSALVRAHEAFRLLEYPVEGMYLLLYLYIAYLVYRLADHLQYERPIYWLLGMILLAPLCVFLLLYINRKATNQLREAGIDVGFMGVSDSEVKQLVKAKKNLF
jgi:NhaP-type Na+/H+ or K+/H+ antiporter